MLKERNELSVKAKNGIDFILAATVIWAMISFIWNLDKTAYNKSVLTFIIGGLLLPLAFGFSKLLNTNWKVEDNPLQPLGLWFNFAQLFYFPFLIFVLLRFPQYFIMTYAIITGAHFFPYAWLYNTTIYAVFAGLISMGSMILGLFLKEEQMYILPVVTSVLLVFMAFLLYQNQRQKSLN